MRFMSTRGGERGLSFEQALFSGYAKDGGLYWPETIPHLSPSLLRSWSRLSYSSLLVEFLSLFIDEEEISKQDLEVMVKRAFRNFETFEVVTTRRLGENLSVLELFHGPTHTFKDLAMSIVARMYEHFLERSKEHKIILVGTSGDTGGAAIAAISNLNHVDLIVLYPFNMVTSVQELEMTRTTASNVHVFAVSGNSDELDVPIRQAFEKDRNWVQNFNLTSINSINVARVLVQTAHAIYACLQSRIQNDLNDADKMGDDHMVELVYPTGAGGNVCGAILAKMMGVSLKCVVSVTQPIIHTLITDLRLNLAKENIVENTLACAIDIGAPYNIERWILMASDNDTKVTKEIMERQGTLPENIGRNLTNVITDSHLTSSEDIKASIKKCYRDFNYKVCPHTATAIDYHYKHPHSKTHRVIVATASPVKFPEALSISHVAMECSSHVEKLKQMKDVSVSMNKSDDWLQMLHEKLKEIKRVKAETRK